MANGVITSDEVELVDASLYEAVDDAFREELLGTADTQVTTTAVVDGFNQVGI